MDEDPPVVDSETTEVPGEDDLAKYKLDEYDDEEDMPGE